MMKHIKKWKIKTRIIFLYITILLLSFLLTFGIISKVNQKYMETEIGEFGVQTVNVLTGNLSFIFDNVTQFSDFIYFDDNIQASLNKVETKDIDPAIQNTIKKSLINIILSGDYISSVFIFDQYYNNYSSYKVGPILVHEDKIQDAAWYRQMQEAHGNGFFIHKSGDVLEFPTREGKNYISYVREIGDLGTYKPIATLLVTIDAETIQAYFNEVSETYESRFFIVDGEGNYIIPPNDNVDGYRNYLASSSLQNGYEAVSMGNERVMMVQKDLGIQDWKLVGSFQMDSGKALAPYYTTNILFIMCLNVMFVFLCSLLLTRLIFTPLSKVENYMNMVEQGDFEEMPVGESDDEIEQLKKVFNRMTVSIQNLIQKVKEEEQIIAKEELDIIQAQINPHFLYNTLDAVSALALMGDHKRCFKMTQALGNFYRNSLNSGMDFVTVGEEIQCIKSYITILNIRYEDKIKVEYDVEEGLKEQYILKLLLQPLIENAVHHGIKGTGECGTIVVKAYRDEDEMIFIVTDDGVGMTEDRIRDVLEGKTKDGKSGFGVYSLMQRISLYYHIDDPLTIHSEINNGTEVTVRVKVLDGGRCS